MKNWACPSKIELYGFFSEQFYINLNNTLFGDSMKMASKDCKRGIKIAFIPVLPEKSE